ncbi:uncharacterized protein LAESUDRAFT_183638 [Laetiporus sulphureus 93-53]|uniref:Uncharacterized protein n=1 Tax=Laetiporus sulphureus 93-53 TaxID=1314785 RepID=A0A165ARD6_9APHY|nr:uncharacterized protein LAESUDRAFT_183638 [Laetiporus sulphureus 93-53]KZS99515.1 hypothetical protein LAESUDRAFT_183638 [Laetiporus sulphureus 93-53]
MASHAREQRPMRPCMQAYRVWARLPCAVDTGSWSHAGWSWAGLRRSVVLPTTLLLAFSPSCLLPPARDARVFVRWRVRGTHTRLLMVSAQFMPSQR